MSISGILTRSGREITPWSGVPSIGDIAASLANLPRFAGHTEPTWSVLEHSLFVEELAHRYAAEHLSYGVEEASLRLAALLHDAHESVTSDVPTTFKPQEMREGQMSLDIRLMDEHFPGGFEGYVNHQELIKGFDRRALLAEALVLHPAISEENIVYYFGASPLETDVQLLQRLLTQAWRPANFRFRYSLLKTRAGAAIDRSVN